MLFIFAVCLYYYRSGQWWNQIVMGSFTSSDWIENFRVSKATFLYLCTELRPAIQHEDTRMRKAITVEKRLAITLWCLATCSEYRTIAHLFGVSRSAVCLIVHETCIAITSILQKKYIEFPMATERRADVVRGFQSRWGLMQCLGSIDGCHIPVMPPALNHTDYYNRKGWYSIILQAVVDSEYLFQDICIGWPGSVHDARVLKNSGIYKRLKNDRNLSESSVSLEGVEIPYFLIGDSAYPLKSFLLKPFTHSTSLSESQKTFNYRLSRARIVVENAFGRLKGRWRRLTKRNDMNVENVPHVVAACCVLHNVCEIHGDTFNENWSFDDEQPSATVTETSAGSNQGSAIRDALVTHFSR